MARVSGFVEPLLYCIKGFDVAIMDLWAVVSALFPGRRPPTSSLFAMSI